MSDVRGSVQGLWVKRAHRGPMDPRPSLELTDEGVRESADRGRARQVTIIREEDFRTVEEELGRTVDRSFRRANVLVRGVELEGTRGRILRLGKCRILIGGETVPCERMDEAVPGLREALRTSWRGGCYGRVLDGGSVHLGDEAWLE